MAKDLSAKNQITRFSLILLKRLPAEVTSYLWSSGHDFLDRHKDVQSIGQESPVVPYHSEAILHYFRSPLVIDTQQNEQAVNHPTIYLKVRDNRSWVLAVCPFAALASTSEFLGEEAIYMGQLSTSNPIDRDLFLSGLGEVMESCFRKAMGESEETANFGQWFRNVRHQILSLVYAICFPSFASAEEALKNFEHSIDTTEFFPLETDPLLMTEQEEKELPCEARHPFMGVAPCNQPTFNAIHRAVEQWDGLALKPSTRRRAKVMYCLRQFRYAMIAQQRPDQCEPDYGRLDFVSRFHAYILYRQFDRTSHFVEVVSMGTCPDFRRQGIAKALIFRLANIFSDRKIRMYVPFDALHLLMYLKSLQLKPRLIAQEELPSAPEYDQEYEKKTWVYEFSLTDLLPIEK